MNKQDERAEICKNCLMFEPVPSLCAIGSFSVDPDDYACGEFLDRQDFIDGPDFWEKMQ